MTKLINKDKLNFYTTNLWNKITEKFVSKTLPNAVTGETILSNGFVNGSSDITKIYNANGITMNLTLPNDTSYFGIPALSVPARTHVDNIVTIIDDGAGNVNDTVTGVNLGVVSIATGRVIEYVHTGATTTIINNPISSGSNSLSGSKAIRITVNKSWNEAVYFLVGGKGISIGWSRNPFPSVGGTSLKGIGEHAGTATESGYVGKMAIYTSKYALNEMAKRVHTFESEISTLKNDYVSKSSENIIAGKTTLLNGNLLNSALTVVNNTGAIYTITNNTSWCGTPSLNVRANTAISYVCVAVDDNLQVGTEIQNVKLAAVRSSDNVVQEVISTTGTEPVRENVFGYIDSIKILMIPVNKSFNQQIYFVVGFNGMKWGPRSFNGWTTVYPGGNAFPAVGTRLTINPSNYIPQAFVMSEEMSLNNILPLMNDKANLTGDNSFSGSSRFEGTAIFNNWLDLKYTHAIEQAFIDGDRGANSSWACYFDRGRYIPRGAYVSTLDIRVDDNLTAGSRLENIYVYEVSRGDNIRNDSIISITSNNAGANIINIDGFGKAIQVHFNKTFTRDTYFIIGHKNATGRLFVANDDRGDIRQIITDSPFVLNMSTNLANKHRNTNNKLIHRYVVEETRNLQTDISELQDGTIKINEVGNTANKIPRLDSNGKIPANLIPTTSSRMIGELKQLAYDGGNVIDEDSYTWLRANGQTISKTEYPALFDKMNTSRNTDLEELQLPQIDDKVGYYYICAS